MIKLKNHYNFYYYDFKGKHYITLKRACPEWVNSDCVPIYYQDNSKILESGLYGWDFNGFDLITLDNIKKFIDRSDRAFVKKYPKLGYNGTNLLKSFIKTYPND